MKRTLALALLIFCVGVSTVPRAGAAEATCLVRIAYDQRNLPDDLGYLEALLGSSGVVTVAAREVPAITAFAEKSALPIGDVLSVGFERAWYAGDAPDRTLFGHLAVNVDSEVDHAERAAEQVMARVCARLESLLTTIAEQDRRCLDTQLASAETEVERATVALQKLRMRQRELSGQAAPYRLSYGDISRDVDGWRRGKQEMELTLAALQARQESLSQQIASVAEQVEQKAVEDPVLTELQKVVDLREERVTRAHVLYEQGKMSVEEQGRPEEELAVARAQLAERRLVAAQAAGAGLLGELNKKLLDVSLEVAETRARLQFLDEKLASVAERDLLSLANLFEGEIEPQLDAAETSLRDAMQWRLRLQQQSRTYQPPHVMILGGTDEADAVRR